MANEVTHMVVQSEVNAAAPQTSSVFFSVGGALMLIIALILVVAWIARRTGLLSAPGEHHHVLKIIDSKSLGSRERLVVVEIEKQWLVLGVTAGQIKALHTLDAPAEAVAAQPPGREGFAQLLRSCLVGRGSE